MTTLEFYLSYPAKSVLAVDCIEDLTSGNYSIFYTYKEGRLLISTSVVSLIKELGGFEFNSAFNPTFVDLWFMEGIKNHEQQQEHDFWCKSNSTIDKRIFRLRTFERRFSTGVSERSLEFRKEIDTWDGLCSLSAEYLTKFINRIELQFPDYVHVILTGGKDSQLIWTVPKIDETKWYCFSSEPEATTAKEFLDRNKIFYKDFFHSMNTETEDFEKKIVCSDCIAYPQHIRYLGELTGIVNKLGNKCIFWLGTMVSAAGFYKIKKPRYYKYYDRFWEKHSEALASADHRTKFNYLECPFLSPFHSDEIWTNVYSRFDPLIFKNKEKVDNRSILAHKLIGRELWWPEEFSGPTKMSASNENNLLLYRQYIEKNIND